MKPNFKILFTAILVLFLFNCKNKEGQAEEKTTTDQTEDRQGQAFITDDVGTPNLRTKKPWLTF